MSTEPPRLPTSSVVPSRMSGLAIASLVLGILSCPLSLLAGIPGLICGILGLRGISRSQKVGTGPRLTGRGLAISGLVLSAITSLLAPALLLPAIMSAREAARTMPLMNNLRLISLAMLTAEQKTAVLPALIIDKRKTPLLSWRVAILPFLGEQEAKLFKEFHLDEPWDSDHNIRLLARMPAVYASPNASDAEKGLTDVVASSAPGAVFGDVNAANSITADESAFLAGVELLSIADGDGLSTTICIMSIPGFQVPWTKPADCGGDPVKLFAKLRGDGVSSILACACDGAVRRVSTSLAPEAIRAIFSWDGRDLVPDDAF